MQAMSENFGMKLNADYYPAQPGATDLIIIHGLFGSAGNFRGLAKSYSEFFNVHCLDLRNHGASPHADEVSYALMASDIIEFLDDNHIDTAHIMGHSMGGKTAMQLAFNYPERINKLVIADIAPVQYPHHHQNVFTGLNSVDFSQAKTRGDVELDLKKHIDDAGVRSFLLTNLVRQDGGLFKWRINVPALIANYNEISAAPKGTGYQGDTLFIRGANSNYVDDLYVAKILELFPKAHIETMDDCGHWLHAEKPADFSRILLDFTRQE